jgi:ornithine carbamoyltransferase
MYREAFGRRAGLSSSASGVTRHFLNLSDAGSDGLKAILAEALKRKEARKNFPRGKSDSDRPLDGHMLAMIFEKNSTRTRASFETGMAQLGGTAMFMPAGQMQLGRGETIADTSRVLSRMADAIMIRTDDHAKIEEMARFSEVPVINGLTDDSHPCQIVADLMTIMERGKSLTGMELAWLGDGNNVLSSIIEAAGLLGFNVRAGCPQGYEPDSTFVEEARSRGSRIDLFEDAKAAASGADVVVTDTWVSMGQEHVHNKMAAMAPFQVNDRLMAEAKSDALFLHCLPAHRGEEATDSVLDGPQSVIWDEAENRIHAQKAILMWVNGLIG